MRDSQGLPDFHRTEIRGHTQIFRPAPLLFRVLAMVIDLQLLLALTSLLIWSAGIAPYWDARWLGPILALFVFVQIAQLLMFSGTWGQRLLGLRRLDPLSRAKPDSFSRWLRSGLFQRETLNGGTLAQSFFFATLTIALGVGSAHLTIRRHPAWSEAGFRSLEPSFPTAAEQRDWIVAPFFYAIGAWPRVFAGQPVLYSLPYEKGPPKHFVGHIVARWEMPETRLSLEGPWSPPERPEPSLVRDCLTEGWISRLKTCLSVRTQTLRKHLEEMSALRPTHWRLEWFEVESPSIPPEERARGFLIEASNATHAQARYVLVNAKGVQQAIVLDSAPGRTRSAQARELLDRTIRSLRVGLEIFPGRAWADRELEGIRIAELSKPGRAEEFLSRYAEVQTLLLSKVSVDPKSFDAFFHLGGTAILLSRFAKKNRDPELSAIAKPLLRNAFRYAQDLAPNDPRTAQLETLWLEVRSD